MGMVGTLLSAILLLQSSSAATTHPCELPDVVVSRPFDCKRISPEHPLSPLSLVPEPEVPTEPATVLRGRASYYSDSLEGRPTASGEIFRQKDLTAAHRTLPLGTIVEVRSVATGRSVRVRINDRGPFTGGFEIDLSRAAARTIGVDRARDRRVEITIIRESEGE